MPDLVNWIVILKPAFAAMTMLGFLRNRCGKFSPLLMGGAVAYGLSSYMMAFFAQAMWTDCVIYAPLILLGLEYLLAGKGNALYMAMLALAVISNFYISFAICLFLVFYVLTRTLPLIWQKDGCGFKGVLKLWLKFAGYSMIGGCIGAVVLIPVALTLTHTIASELGAPEKMEWYKNFFDLLSHLLPGTELVYVYDYANFAVGLLIFLTIPLYFLNKSIRPGERIAHGVLLLFLILASQFESLLQPVIILTEIIVDIFFSLLVLWLLGVTINLMSMIGLVVVSGIVINDSILKIDTINRLRRQEGIPLREAILEAGRRRMKAILMTSLTTVLAVCPFLARGSMGADLQYPMSLVIVAGLTVGTLVSLFVVPALYYSLYRDR